MTSKDSLFHFIIIRTFYDFFQDLNQERQLPLLVHPDRKMMSRRIWCGTSDKTLGRMYGDYRARFLATEKSWLQTDGLTNGRTCIPSFKKEWTNHGTAVRLILYSLIVCPQEAGASGSQNERGFSVRQN